MEEQNKLKLFLQRLEENEKPALIDYFKKYVGKDVLTIILHFFDNINNNKFIMRDLAALHQLIPDKKENRIIVNKIYEMWKFVFYSMPEGIINEYTDLNGVVTPSTIQLIYEKAKDTDKRKFWKRLVEWIVRTETRKATPFGLEDGTKILFLKDNFMYCLQRDPETNVDCIIKQSKGN